MGHATSVFKEILETPFQTLLQAQRWRVSCTEEPASPGTRSPHPLFCLYCWLHTSLGYLSSEIQLSSSKSSLPGTSNLIKCSEPWEEGPFKGLVIPGEKRSDSRRKANDSNGSNAPLSPGVLSCVKPNKSKMKKKSKMNRREQDASVMNPPTPTSMILGGSLLSPRGIPDFQTHRLVPELKGGTGMFWGFETHWAVWHQPSEHQLLVTEFSVLSQV